MNRLAILPLLLVVPGLSLAQASPADASHNIPVINGAAGSCSLDLTVTADGRPVYAASVKVHIAYGFGGFHKLDLEASTNVDGKVRFTGLPAKVRRPPLDFRARKDALVGNVGYDPATQCQATQEIKLGKAAESTVN